MYILSSRIKIKIIGGLLSSIELQCIQISLLNRFKHQFHNKFKMTPSEMANDPAHQKC